MIHGGGCEWFFDRVQSAVGTHWIWLCVECVCIDIFPGPDQKIGSPNMNRNTKENIVAINITSTKMIEDRRSLILNKNLLLRIKWSVNMIGNEQQIFSMSKANRRVSPEDCRFRYGWHMQRHKQYIFECSTLWHYHMHTACNRSVCINHPALSVRCVCTWHALRNAEGDGLEKGHLPMMLAHPHIDDHMPSAKTVQKQTKPLYRRYQKPLLESIHSHPPRQSSDEK